MDRLWYRHPASMWEEALPLGNGHLGAMVFGGIAQERIALNDDSLWSGGPHDRINPDAKGNLEEIRRLIFKGKIPEAEELALYALSGTPEYQRIYQPLGDLHITFLNAPGEIPEDYTRSLDLEEAQAHVTYTVGNTRFTRRAYVSAADDVLVLHCKAEGEEKLHFRAWLRRGRLTNLSVAHDGNALSMEGQAGDEGMGYCCRVRAVSNGKVETIGDHLIISDATEATLYLTATTTFRRPDPAEYCERMLQKAVAKGETAILTSHYAEYSVYYSRVKLSLGEAAADTLPTDELLAQTRGGILPPSLASLYFNYGRYLLIASSRPGTLPATLQGIWNEQFLPPWDSKYTININIQMNYWPAETCALPEMHLSLFDHLWRMLGNGQAVADRMYGCRGFAAHHNTDIWGDCAPQDHYIPASYWPMGAAWLCLHIWEHYDYTRDESFLREHFDLLEQAVLFFVDFLVKDGQGRMVTNPSVSPENTYILPTGVEGRLCYGASMDNQILHALFTDYLRACEVLNVPDGLAQEVKKLRDALPPPSIGQHGQLMEWPEDYDEKEPGHRHISHLFGLYPGNQFTREETPDLLAACRATLERRLASGGGHTGWSRAWIIGLWARLGEGDKAAENLLALLAGSTFANLMDNHPYSNSIGYTFQIDGNFGATAAIAEMLVQSREGAVFLLPALPEGWPDGRVSGLRARGGVGVSIVWADGELVECMLVSDEDCRLTVCYGDRNKEVDLKAGVRETVAWGK